VELGNDIERDEKVGFTYLTPISSPAINGPNSRVEEPPYLLPDGEQTALVFGMIEAPNGEIKVSAETIVYDPQRPRDAEPLELSGLTASRFIVVANRNEVRRLGGNEDLLKAAEQILADQPKVVGVITKRGAAGCLVSQRDGKNVDHQRVGAHPTSRVWPIGSGDVFSAGFAHAIDMGRTLNEAAELGSAATAHWCSTQNPAISEAILGGNYDEIPLPILPSMPQVYIAAPFFTVGERWLVETVYDELFSLGVQRWSPVHEVGFGDLEVAKKDLDGLLASDVVLALLDHADPGTVFEVGYAVSQGIPVVGYAETLSHEGVKMMAGTQVELHRDLSTACYRAAWVGMGLRPRPGWLTE